MTTLEQPKSPSLMRQISHYFGGQIAVMAAGFITMPIVTRLMSPEQYGIANLVNTAMWVLVAVAKLGFPPAALRFAGHARPGEERRETVLQSTLLSSGLAFSAVCAALFAVVSWVFVGYEPVRGSWQEGLFRFLYGSHSTAAIFVVACMLVVPRTITAILWSLMRAEERSREYSAFAVWLRYTGQVLAIGAFLYWRTLTAYFAGIVIGEGLVVLWVFSRWWLSHHLSVRQFEVEPLRNALSYGLPLVALEITAVVLAYSDKYILQFLLGAEAVGRYSAGYNVAELMPALLVFPVQMAILPYAFKLFEREGEERVQGFVASSASRYALVAFPLMALFCAVAPTIVLVLASAKYITSIPVIPWVVVGQVLWMGFFPLVSMGYQIRKRTNAVAFVQVFGVMLNIGLNLLLIPRMGYKGSAVATFITCALVVAITAFNSRRLLRVPWQAGSLARATVISTLLGVLLYRLPLGWSIPAALARVALGALLYVRIITPMDGNARWLVRAGIKFVRERGLHGRWVYWLTGLSPVEAEGTI